MHWVEWEQMEELDALKAVLAAAGLEDMVLLEVESGKDVLVDASE